MRCNWLSAITLLVLWLVPRGTGAHQLLPGQHEEAWYRATIAANPGHAKAHNNLGLLLEDGREDFDGAEAAYHAAIAADPGYANAHHNLGVLLEQEGDLCRAEAAFRAAVEADPGKENARSALAAVVAARGRVA